MRELFAGFFDDAAVFPPGDLPLARAVPAYLAHREGEVRDLVGSFVLGAADLPALAEALAGRVPPGSFDLAVTADLTGWAAAQEALGRLPEVRLRAWELRLPDDLPADRLAAVLAEVALESAPESDPAARPGDVRPSDVPVYLEVPRDARRTSVIRALPELGDPRVRAKLRTGGVRAELYPDEAELAATLVDLAAAGVRFKATAGLHHAVRRTDPATGFAQHGFLNLLHAWSLAVRGAGVDDLVAVLACRDPDEVTAGVRGTAAADPGLRRGFCAVGTCSIDEPTSELAALGLLGTAGEESR